MEKKLEDRPASVPEPRPTPVYLTSADTAANDLDLFDLVEELWKRKWIVIAITAAFGLLGVAYAFFATERFRASAVLAPAQQDEQSSLPSGIGSLASLAGIRIGASGNDARSVATLRSRALIEDFITTRNLLPVLFVDEWDASREEWIEQDPEDQPNILDGVKYFVENLRFIDENVDNGLVTLTIEWTDPEIAAAWAAQLVALANDRLRQRDIAESEARLEYLNEQLNSAQLVELRQAISRLIEEQIQTLMLAQADPEYAFQVIDPPRPPNEHTSPRRLLIVALAIVAGGLTGLFCALFIYASDSRRSSRPSGG